MKGFTHSVRWFTAAALLCAMPVTSALAAKTTPATDKNTNVPAVPRAIPDLIPYHKFDPPKSPAFDINKLTISGDMRVRPEFRTNNTFGNSKSNAFFSQQLIRLGFAYAISPDVEFFLQPQVSNNFGANETGQEGTGGVNPNGTSTDLFLRQGFMLVRNFIAPNLTLKAGRQLVVWGNHRIFGHFDWNNVGFAFDGVTFRYNHKMFPVETGWLRVAEGNCAQNAGGCGAGKASSDGDIVFVRIPAKIWGIAIEPAWIWESGGAGANNNIGNGGQPMDQTRHTVGARIATKKGMFDVTLEGYHQFGSIGDGSQGRFAHINAIAGHIDGGVTLPVPMQPRIGLEFNYGSGDGDNIACNASPSPSACGGNVNTFSQLFPTNHIHFGYMDRMSWQNMVDYSANLQMRPTKNSHFEIAGHIVRRANNGDFWYQANQATFLAPSVSTNPTSNSLFQEIDAVYTLFFQGNKVAWQIGYGHMFPGKYVEQFTGNSDPPGSDWGYTQLWINF